MLKRQAHCCRRIGSNDWKDNEHLGCIVSHAVLVGSVVSNTTRQLTYHVILSACPSRDLIALHYHFLEVQRPTVRSPPCRRRGTCLPLPSHKTTKAFLSRRDFFFFPHAPRPTSHPTTTPHIDNIMHHDTHGQRQCQQQVNRGRRLATAESGGLLGRRHVAGLAKKTAQLGGCLCSFLHMLRLFSAIYLLAPRSSTLASDPASSSGRRGHATSSLDQEPSKRPSPYKRDQVL